MKIQTQLRAVLAARSLERKSSEIAAIGSGFFVELFKALLPLLLECFDPDDGQEVKSYVAARRNDKRLRKGIARRAKIAARKQGARLAWRQARLVADEVIEQIATTESSDITLVIREHDVL